MKLEDLGEHLLKFRKSLGMTQRELAKRLGVTPQAVGQWESGGMDVPIKRIPQLEDILGIKIELEDINQKPFNTDFIKSGPTHFERRVSIIEQVINTDEETLTLLERILKK
jgi:transcriptional regulator with XRE-family HTH domain